MKYATLGFALVFACLVFTALDRGGRYSPIAQLTGVAAFELAAMDIVQAPRSA